MATKGGRIDFMFLGPSPTRPLDPLLKTAIGFPITELNSCSVCAFSERIPAGNWKQWTESFGFLVSETKYPGCNNECSGQGDSRARDGRTWALIFQRRWICVNCYLGKRQGGGLLIRGGLSSKYNSNKKKKLNCSIVQASQMIIIIFLLSEQYFPTDHVSTGRKYSLYVQLWEDRMDETN